MAKLGEPISDKSTIILGIPPILFQLQPEGYVRVVGAAAVKDWEERLKKYYGIDSSQLRNITPLDTCSGGCADDCGGAI